MHVLSGFWASLRGEIYPSPKINRTGHEIRCGEVNSNPAPFRIGLDSDLCRAELDLTYYYV